MREGLGIGAYAARRRRPRARPLRAPRLPEVLVGAVVAPDDAVTVAAEAAHVHLDAAPGGQAAVLDAELPVDVDRATGVGGQEGEEGGGEVPVVAGIVVTAGALAGAAEEVAGVVVGDGVAAAAAGVGLCLAPGARRQRRERPPGGVNSAIMGLQHAAGVPSRLECYGGSTSRAASARSADASSTLTTFGRRRALRYALTALAGANSTGRLSAKSPSSRRSRSPVNCLVPPRGTIRSSDRN